MHSIATAVRSPTPQWIFYARSQITVDRVGAVFSIVEAIFYSSLQSKLSSVRWIKDVYWAKELYSVSLQKIHTAFNIANSFLIWAYSANITLELARHPEDMSGVFFFFISLFLPIFGFIDNTNQQGAQKLHILKSLLNVSLIYFAKSRFTPSVAFISSVVSLWKNTQIDYSALPKPEDCKESRVAENAYAAYNIAQATLAYFQKYPEFSLAVYNIQELLILVDLGWIIWNADVLCEKIKDRYAVRTMGKDEVQTSGAWFMTKRNEWNPLAAVAMCAAAIAFAYFAILSLQTYLQWAVPIKELWNQIGGVSKKFKTLNIQWRFATFLQSVYFFRMLLIGALAYFSERRSAHLISLVAQGYSLSAISKLKWAKLTWTIPNFVKRKIVLYDGTILC